MALPGTLLRSVAGIVGEPHVLTGDATAGYAVDWTGRFAGRHRPSSGRVIRRRWRRVLALCTEAGLPVVPQGGTPAWSAAACPGTARSC